MISNIGPQHIGLFLAIAIVYIYLIMKTRREGFSMPIFYNLGFWIFFFFAYINLWQMYEKIGLYASLWGPLEDFVGIMFNCLFIFFFAWLGGQTSATGPGAETGKQLTPQEIEEWLK